MLQHTRMFISSSFHVGTASRARQYCSYRLDSSRHIRSNVYQHLFRVILSARSTSCTTHYDSLAPKRDMKSSTKSTFRCWEYIFVVAVTTKIALASDICSKTPWSDCICCTGKPGKECKWECLSTSKCLHVYEQYNCM